MHSWFLWRWTIMHAMYCLISSLDSASLLKQPLYNMHLQMVTRSLSHSDHAWVIKPWWYSWDCGGISWASSRISGISVCRYTYDTFVVAILSSYCWTIIIKLHTRLSACHLKYTNKKYSCCHYNRRLSKTIMYLSKRKLLEVMYRDSISTK